MAIWPFNRRNKNQENVPEEIQEYYQSERRERVGIAWLLAFVTLVVTVLLAVGLFFGGRWVYRAVFESDDDNQVTQQDTEEENQVQDSPVREEAAPEPAEDEPADQPDNSDAEETPEQEPSLPGDQADETDEPSSPVTTDRDADADGLPDTGPGDVAAVFAVTTAVSTLAHHVVTSRRNKNF